MSSVFGGLSSFARRPRGAGDRPPVDYRPRVMGEPVDGLPAVLPEVRRGRRRRITVIGEPVLHTPCREVTEFGTRELRDLINDMHATNAVAHGAGLAATQIGVDLRVFVYDCTDPFDVRHVGHVVNPVLERLDPQDAGSQSGWEGCLSVPGGGADLSRAHYAAVRGVDQFGKPVRIDGTGLFARCLAHETDHLDGILYVDHLSARDRKAALREMESEKESIWAEWDERARDLGKATFDELTAAAPSAPPPARP